MTNMTVGDLMDLIKNLDRDTPVCMKSTSDEGPYIAKPVSMTNYYGGPEIFIGYKRTETDRTGHPVRTDGWDYVYTIDPRHHGHDPQVLLIETQTPDDYESD
jgi:hypothetical protein